ncbi:MAG TPA: hypothetical protein VJX67_21245 [Blastocatellia bacterium]|nr:hypothetical protein [Blastocatellia bacterium]
MSNLVAALHLQLKARPCRVFSTGLRVQVSPTGLYTYPDVVVVRGTESLAFLRARIGQARASNRGDVLSVVSQM